MEPGLNDPFAALRDLIPVLEELTIPYLVGGSFASGIHGEFRATQDIDILADFRGADVPEFICRTSPGFFVDDVSAPQAVAEARSFNIIHRATAFKVDIFTRVEAFEECQLARTVAVEAYGAGLKVNVASAEDCILSKLRWYKMGGCTSERQWNDLLGVMHLQRERLDDAYLEKWAEKLGLANLLDRLRK